MTPRVLMLALFFLLAHFKTSTKSTDSVASVGAKRKKYFMSRCVRAAELDEPHMKIFFIRSATKLAGLLTELL